MTKLCLGVALAMAAAVASHAPAAAAISTTNLISHFRFNETTGTTANGQINGFNGTLTSFTSGYWVSGRDSAAKNALVFSGGQVVAVPHSSTLNNITNALTISAWIKVANTSGTKSIVHRQYGSGNGEWYNFAVYGTSLHMWMNGSGTLDCDSGGLTWSTSTWYHVAVTWGSGVVKLWRNGTQVGSNCTYNPGSLSYTDSNGFQIGAGKDGGSYGEYFNGTIDDLLVWSREVSGSEMTELAASGRPTYTKYWIGASGTTSFDDNTKWSLTSGGAATDNTSAPNSSDDTVVFSSNFTGSTNFVTDPDVAGLTLQSGYTGTVGAGTAISAVSIGSGGLTLQGGTFKLPTTTFTCSGTLSFSAGTLDASNMTSWSWGTSFTQTGGTFTPPTSSMTVSGDLNLSTGTFGAPPTLTVSGAFNHTSGTFTHNSGTVVLTSTSAKTLKGGPFYDLQIGSTAGTNANLELHWRFDETSGTSAVDASGNSRSGTYTGSTGVPAQTANGATVSFTNGKSLTFTMANRHAVGLVPSPSALQGASMTFMAWYKGTAQDSSASDVLSLGDVYFLRVRTTSIEVCKRISGSHQCTNPTVTGPLDGNWHHIAGTVSGAGGIEVFFDGISKGTGSNTSAVDYSWGTDFYVGRHGRGDATFDFGGQIDDVRVYSRVLSAAEIANIAGGSDYSVGGAATGATHTLGTNVTVADDLTIGGAAGLDLSTYTLTVGDAWSNSGTFTASTGTVVLTGSSRNLPAETYYNLTVNATAGQTLTQTAALTVQNDLTISSGTLATANYAIGVAGSFVNSGTFTSGTGTVTLSGTTTGESLTSGGSSFYNLTINSSNGNGAWTLGSATTTVTNTLAITSGTLTIADKTLTNTGASTAAAIGAASGNTATVTLTTGTLSATPGLTINATGTVSMSSTASLLIGGGTTLTVNGALGESHAASYQDVAKTAGSKPSIAAISGRYAFAVAGATATLNLDGVDITATDTNGVTVTSATNSTFTAFKNLRFTGGTGARYVYVSAPRLGLFMDDCYFDNATTANVAVADSTPSSKDVRISLRYKDSTQNGAGAGESRDSDDDSGADGVADGAGGVVEWLTYFPDLTSTGTGSVAGFPTAAFDWDDFASYGTYVAMNDVNGSGDAIIFARSGDGSNKAYSATIAAANGDVIGTPRWWNASGSNTRYVFVATQTGSAGKIYKYQDTGAALTLVSNWPFSNATYMGQITTPLAMDDQYLYVAANHPSDGTTKYIFRIDHTAANPNSSYTTYTYASSGATATAISASPALNMYNSKPYVFFVNQGRVVRTDGNNFSSSIYGTAAAEAPSNTVSGRVAVFSNVLYYGDNSGVVAVKDANDTTAPYFANIWSYTSSSCTLCRILAMTVGFEPTDTSTYPRIYWGDGDGDAYAIKRNGATTGGTDISGFPFATSTYASTSTVSISAAPLYQNGVVVIGNDGGDVFVLNQATTSGGAPTVTRQQFLGGTISAISRDFLNDKYLVVSGIRLHVLSTYSDPDAYR